MTTKAPRVPAPAAWAAEVERRQGILAELRRLCGLPIPERSWRYDYSLDEVYQIVVGVMDQGSHQGHLDPGVQQTVQGGFR